jgi:hypothetical protein
MIIRTIPASHDEAEAPRPTTTRSRRRRVAAACLLLATSPLQAEEWTHELAPYMWGAGMDGSTGVGPVIADVDVGFSDILDNLEAGFMGMYRASRDGWSITADLVYMGLGATERGPGGQVVAGIDLDQTAFELDIGREVAANLIVFGGLRYNDISAEVRATGPLGEVRTADGDESWVDPVIGALYTIPFSDALSLTLRGDVGGFGLGSA